MFDTFNVTVCSCDMWQLEQCRSDRLSPWCVRQQKSVGGGGHNEKGKTYTLHIFVQALSQGNNTEAVAYIQRCKDMLLRLPKDVSEAPMTSYIVVKAFLGFGGCCCKCECMFCMADGISLSDVLQLWCWYLQHEKVRGQHNLVEVAIILLWRKV